MARFLSAPSSDLEELMNDNLKAFCEGFVRGAKETPRQFFAPVIAISRWMCRVTVEAMAPPRSTFTISPAATRSLETTAKQLGVDPAVALELAIHHFSRNE